MNDLELQPATMQEQLDEISAQLHDAMAGIIADWVEMWERVKAFINASLADTLQELADAIRGLHYDVQLKKNHPRPPRYAGPKNKGRLWTMAPQRVARSNCRRYRR
jgi:hypothetical protein